MGWAKLIAAILGGAGSILFAWRYLKKKYKNLKSYYNIIAVLVEAIEDIEQLTGKIPDNVVAISKFIKAFVYKMLSTEDRIKLDSILTSKGYLNKKGVKN